MSDYSPTPQQEKAIREYLHKSIVPLIEQVLVKKLGQAMSYAAQELVNPKREWVGLTDDELRAAYRKGRDSIPSPDSGWEWVDNHTPGLREVELTLYRKNNNGDVV